MEYHERKLYEKYTEKEKRHLWDKHHLQPCVYCGVLTTMCSCCECGYKEDRALEKVD